MNYILSKHAQKEILRRQISEDIVKAVVENPDQIVEEYGNKMAYQSIIDFGVENRYLVRVIINVLIDPMVVVTVYKTSKIQKYWRES